MSDNKTCPDPQHLQALLAETLAAAEQHEIARHVEGCEHCQKNLEHLATSSWEGRVRNLEAEEAETGPGLQKLLARVQHRTDTAETQGEPFVGQDELLSFLDPAKDPKHLGRLGHYEILEVIGKGGFGIVLKGFDERLHRVVAVKVLSPAFAANGSARKRFIREARAAAAVKNEHVVGIYEVQDEAQPPYLVMELIDGMSLQDKLDRHGSLGVKEILRIGSQAACGLAAAHKQGLVHRDIKPANILLENGVERVKITDFGLARAVDDASVTQSGTVAGTPMYMSPEQAEGLPVDHRSDLFSLGTVLYAMCTGHSPFRASGTHAVLKRVIDATPRPIREINSEIPDWLSGIISKLHAKKPEDRFQTANDVAELLGQHLAHVQQPNLTPLPASLRQRDLIAPAGKRLPVLPLVIFALVLVGLLVGSLWAGTERGTIVGLLLGLAAATTVIGLFWVASRLGTRPAKAANADDADRLPGRPGSSNRRWVFVAVTLLVIAAGGLALTELAGLTHLLHAPSYTITLGLDDPDIGVGVWPAVDGEDFETFAAQHGPLKATRYVNVQHQISLTPGNYWFVAVLSGKRVYHQLVTVSESRVVPFPWATIFVQEEKEKLQGSWHAVLAERDGSALPKEFVDKMDFRLTFTGDKVTVQMQETADFKRIDKQGTYTINPRKKPATLDLNVLDGKPMPAIYRIDGDELFLCLPAANERPSSFTSKGGEYPLFVLKRDKADSSAGWKDEPGFVPLFDGKGFAGWVTPDPGAKKIAGWELWQWGGKPPLPAFSVFATGQANNLFTERDDYADFHLRAVLMATDAPAGIFFRCGLNLPHGKFPAGYEAVVGNQTYYKVGTLRVTTADSDKPAFLVKVPETTVHANPGFAVPLGKDFTQGASVSSPTYFRLDVIARGNHIVVKVNDKIVADYTDPKSTYTKGRIGLHGLYINKLEIKELPPSKSENPGAIDLMPLAQPNPKFGTWKREGTTLVSIPPLAANNTKFTSAVPIVAELPDEFILEAVFERLAGDDTIAFNVPAFGTDFMLSLDGFPELGWRSGLCNIAGKDYRDNETSVPGRQIVNGKKHMLQITIRTSGVAAKLDGKTLVDYRGGYDKLASPSAWAGKNKFYVVIIDSPFRFHSLQLIPLKKASLPAGPFVLLSPNRKFVVMETSLGRIKIEVYPDKTPVTVQNFLEYVDDKFYDGTIFHRVMPNFMIQGGGFKPGLKAKRTPGPIKNEAAKGLSNTRGTIAMARAADPDSATAQFYFNVKDNALLDAKMNKDGYCVFGKVIEGMDVVEKISNEPTESTGQHENVPKQDILILSVRPEERRFETLAEAVAAAQTGDTIEIRGDGPFVTQSLEIKKGPLMIRAGKGFHPVISLAPESQSGFLVKHGGLLILEGLELRRKGHPDWEYAGLAPRLVQADSASLYAANCRFVVELHGTGIFAGSSKDVVLRNCEYITSGKGPAFVLWANPSGLGAGSVHMENCTVLGGYSVVRISFREHSANQGVKITGCTAAVEQNPIWFYTPFRPDPAKKYGGPAGPQPLRFELTRNVFKSGDAAVQFNHVPGQVGAPVSVKDLEKLLPHFMTWEGRDNALDLPLAVAYTWQKPGVAREQHLKRSEMTLDEWKKFWGSAETDTRLGPVLFQGKDVLLKAAQNPVGVVPDDLRLTSKSTGYQFLPGGKDLGADVDKVGPGKAYEAWQKTAEYQEWRKKTAATLGAHEP